MRIFKEGCEYSPDANKYILSNLNKVRENSADLYFSIFESFRHPVTLL